MIKRALSTIAALALLGLLGCHATLQPQAGHERVDLWIQPTLMNAYALQAEVKPWKKGDIERLDILPYIRTPDGSYKPISSVSGLPVELGHADRIRLSMASPSIPFDRPIAVRNLRARQYYRIYAQAYDGAGKLISTDDAGSYVEVDVGYSDQAQLNASRLPVTLLDKLFDAKAQVTLGVSGATNRVNSLSATVYRMDGETAVELAAPASLAKAALPGTLTLSNLRAQTTYRVLATAKDTQDAPLATGSVEVPVGIDPSVGDKALTLPIPEYPLSARIGP